MYAELGESGDRGLTIANGVNELLGVHGLGRRRSLMVDMLGLPYPLVALL